MGGSSGHEFDNRSTKGLRLVSHAAPPSLQRGNSSQLTLREALAQSDGWVVIEVVTPTLQLLREGIYASRRFSLWFDCLGDVTFEWVVGSTRR